MKKFVFAALVAAFSASSLASKDNVRFVAVDDSLFSNICVVAAQEGVIAARKVAPREFNESIRCNGQTINTFARQYTKADSAPIAYKFVLADERPESMLCKQAVSEGVESLGLTRGELDNIFCNGVRLTTFAKAYQAN
ncbi:hypothetical protein P2G88_03000 [Aliiglaciecola sp. CAU 1673]|uniref:hypothetical protein n=1 Tax=Aliiglaciecola sp. CAU 1673 TaxID=3032595 RepID=UPI0023DBB507|nr:hypothetical protein [Aliiglaciecola sp. CAU 1673]MDF2177209.1 hypothetical protein [Aliiglaciecola sp. CAU 1673]